MNIDSRVITVILFLVIQGAAVIWWGSGINSEVERLAGVTSTLAQFDKQTALTSAKVEQMSDELERIREKNQDIENQHGRIFDLLQNSSSQSVKSNPYE